MYIQYGLVKSLGIELWKVMEDPLTCLDYFETEEEAEQYMKENNTEDDRD